MDEQEQADRMAAAEALYMISTRARKGKGEAATRRSKRGRKKKEIVDYGDDKERMIQSNNISEDEEMGVKLKKQKRGQPDASLNTPPSDTRAGKVKTQGRKSSRETPEIDEFNPTAQSKSPRAGQRKKYNFSAEIHQENFPSSVSEMQSENKKQGKGKNKAQSVEQKSKFMEGKEGIKALGFTGMPVTLSKSPPKVARVNKPASPRRIPSTNPELSQPQVNSSPISLKSTDSTSLPSTTNLLSMNMNMSPEVVNLPSLPTGIRSLQLSSVPMPNLSSLSETKRDEPAINNDSKESQKQLPLKKRKINSAQVEEEKPAEDVSDGEEEVNVGQVRATFTVQAPPIITMQTLMEIKTALTPDEDGDLPLHIAVVHENMRMVTKLINLMRIAVKGVDKFNKQQQTPLHLAVKLNFVPAVDLLITSGANINTVDWTGSSAVHMAVQGGFYECLELLLKRCPNAEINARNFEGLSPLHLAVGNRDVRQVQLLLKYGADIDLPDGKSGRTALFHAAEINQKNLVELLLKQGANPELPNYAGVTTTMAAQGRNLHSILKLIGSVVQDKQESKWTCVTVKNQSGSVMEIKPSDETRDGSPSLFQHSLSPSSQSGGSDKTKTYRNMLVITDSDRKAAEIERKSSPHSKTASHAPEVKVEVEVLNSNGSSDSSVSHGQRSLPSLPLVSVKQEVMDTSSEDKAKSDSVSSNEYMVVSKSTGLPLSMDEKAFAKSGPTASLKLNTTSASPIPGSQFTRQISLLQQTIPPKIQQLQQEMSTLSLPPSSSSTSSTPTSPRSPASAAASSDTVTLTSTQARLYKKLLEMCNLNTAISAGQNTSPPTLKSMPIFPSSSLPPTSSSPQTSSKDPTHSPVPSLLSLQFLATKSQEQKHPPYLLQRSLSMQDSSRPMESRTPPQRVSVLRVADPTFRADPNKYNHEDNPHQKSQMKYYSDLPRSDKELDSDVPLNLSAKSDAATRYESSKSSNNGNAMKKMQLPVEVQVSIVSRDGMPPRPTVPLQSKQFHIHELQNVATDNASHVPSLAPGPSDLSVRRAAEKMSVSLLKKNLSGKLEKETARLDHNVVVPDFPHIAKTVTPETATFMRNFLSQQQQQHQQFVQTQNGASCPLGEMTSHLSKSQSLPVFASGTQAHPRALGSINIPPIRSSPTSFSQMTQSSSLPSSPSSVSTLPLSLNKLDPRKQYVTLTKNAAGIVTVNSQASAVLSAGSNSLDTSGPTFLHQGHVIDLSTGDESRGHDPKSTDTSKGMEGKVVGFSGAIISMASSSVEKPIVKSCIEMVKPEKPPKPPEVSTVVKDKVKKKSKKGSKPPQSQPNPSETTQNKINHETDQRLKKYLGMKRTEVGATSKAEKVKKEENDLEVKKTHYHQSEEMTSDQGQAALDTEPTIETVGIFSGNIQHVRVKPPPSKSVPSLSSKTGTVTRKPLAATVDKSNSQVSSPKQPTSSAYSSEESGLVDEMTKVDSDKGRLAGDDPLVKTDDNMYYSERIVWRSSPLLPLAGEKEIRHKKLRKSLKPKETEALNAAVIVRPAQENTTFSSNTFRMLDDSVDVGSRPGDDNDKVEVGRESKKTVSGDGGSDWTLDKGKDRLVTESSGSGTTTHGVEHNIGEKSVSLSDRDNSLSSRSSETGGDKSEVKKKAGLNNERFTKKDITEVGGNVNTAGSSPDGEGKKDIGSEGGNECDNDDAIRHSMEEDQALVIDLETPGDKAPPPMVAITTS